MNKLLKDLEKLLRSKSNVDLYIKVSDVLEMMALLKKGDYERITTTRNAKQ